MKIEKFEDIIAWQKAKELTVNIYSVTKSLKDYGFKDQIHRASVSIMNNIAEGYERQSNKEFRQFLYVSKGSCGEVRSMLSLAICLDYISKEKYDNLFAQVEEISKILSGFIRKL